MKVGRYEYKNLESFIFIAIVTEDERKCDCNSKLAYPRQKEMCRKMMITFDDNL